jgi:hypothetical protein
MYMCACIYVHIYTHIHTCMHIYHLSLTQVQDGRVRVNYYIREMYGIPEQSSDVWNSPLGVLVQAGSPEIFNHPVMEKLLEVKWERFGYVCV